MISVKELLAEYQLVGLAYNQEELISVINDSISVTVEIITL